MSERSAAIGLASFSSAWPPPNSSACVFDDERPGDGFDETARGERAARLAGAVLDRGEHRAAPVVAALERRHRDAIDADDAHDLLDDVGLAVHIRPPARHRHLDDGTAPAT